MGDTFENRLRSLAARVEDLEADKQKRAVKDLQEGDAKFMGEVYRGSTAYTNLIVASGYASAFAVWSFARHYLTAKSEVYVALLLIFSISIFVAWNVYQMICMYRVVAAHKRSMSSDVTDVESWKRATQDRALSVARMQTRFALYWVVVLVATITSATIAVGIMLSALVDIAQL